ncbi:MAG TPA: hypothetical protein VKX41_22665 [Alloacidobacterium sp.]|jgi:hypothetical protein|nr:hypothetical protein [Alloacidobacterium sp.]
MACCGQQRAALVQGRATGPQTFLHEGASVAIRFKQPSAIMVRGPVTGRHYQFNGSANSQHVDARDAAALIRTGYFQRA